MIHKLFLNLEDASNSNDLAHFGALGARIILMITPIPLPKNTFRHVQPMVNLTLRG